MDLGRVFHLFLGGGRLHMCVVKDTLTSERGNWQHRRGRGCLQS